MNAPTPLVACPCCGQPTAVSPQGILDGLVMSRLQRKLADRLCVSFGRFLGRNDLIEALYGNRGDGGPATAPKIIDVEIHYLRQILSESTLAIETSGRGPASSGRRLTWRKVIP